MNIKILPRGPIARATIQTSFVLGLRLLVQAGTLLLVARMLEPFEFGAFAGIAALAVLLGTFSTFGTHLVLLGEMSKDPYQREHILSYAVPTTLIGGSLLFFVYIAVCLLFFHNVELSLSVILCIGFTETILLPLFLIPATEELALEKTARSQLLMIFPLSLRTLAAALVMFFDVKQPLVIFAWLYLTSAALALLCMKWYKPNAWLSPNAWRLAKKQELKHSAGYAALAMTAAGPSEIDKMLAAKLLPLGIAGLYIAASRAIGAATLPVIALLLSAMPRLFRIGDDTSKQSKQLTLWVFGAVFIYSMCLVGILWLASPIFEWLLGVQYVGVADMLAWLCFAVPALALRYSTGSILITMNRPWLRAGFEIVGVLILFIAANLLIPQMGAYGMPIALACSEWVMAIAGGIIAFNVNAK